MAGAAPIVLVAGFVGFVLGWPIDWTIRRFPRGEGTVPSRRRLMMISVCTGLLFAGLALRFGTSASLVPALVLCGVLVPVSLIDLRYRIIPNVIVLPASLGVYLAAVAAQPQRWLELLLGGLGAFLLLGLVGVLAPSGMGMGDVKLALVIGLALGRYTSVALVVACLPSLLVLIRHRTRARGLTIPFGPSLALGAFVALLWGSVLLHAYLSRVA